MREANVDDFPLPVGPVTKTSPCLRLQNLVNTSGDIFSSSKLGITVGIIRYTPLSPRR